MIHIIEFLGHAGVICVISYFVYFGRFPSA